MNYKNIIYVFLIIVAIGSYSCQKTDKKTTKETEIPKENMNEKLLRHVVIFKFTDSTTEAKANELNAAFAALPEAIPEIKDFEWGINDSPENFHQDFTHCYLVTFASEYDRDSVYSPHPAHQAFVSKIQPHIEKVFVVDYWTNP